MSVDRDYDSSRTRVSKGCLSERFCRCYRWALSAASRRRCAVTDATTDASRRRLIGRRSIQTRAGFRRGGDV